MNDWLCDHKVNNEIVLPCAAMVELTLAAGVRMRGETSRSKGPICLEDFIIQRAVVVRDVRDESNSNGSSTCLRSEIGEDGSVEM